jgi:hypothetical protein
MTRQGPDDHSTVAFITVVAAHCAASGRHDWSERLERVVDEMLPPADRRQRMRDRRDVAIRAAAAILRQPHPSATAKEVDDELRKFLANVWSRQRDLSAPAPGSSALRQNLWIIAKLTDGEGLKWARILQIIET